MKRTQYINQNNLEITFFLLQTTSPAVLEAAAFLAVKLIAGNEARTNELIEMGIGELLVKKLRKYDHDSSTIGQLAWLLFYLASNETQFSKLMQLGILDLAFVHLQNQSSAISKNVFSLTAFLRLIGNVFSVQSSTANEIVGSIFVSDEVEYDIYSQNQMMLCPFLLQVVENTAYIYIYIYIDNYQLL